MFAIFAILTKMRDFTKQHGGSPVLRFLLGIGGVLLLLLITFGAVRAGYSMYSKFSEAADSDAQAHAELASLKAQQAQVSASVHSLSSPRGVEAQVRQEYGVAKPGEGKIQIVRDVSATNTDAGGQEGNFFNHILQALFGWL